MIELPTPTEEQIREYMELHNADEVGIDDQWDMETALYYLLLDDEWYYKRKEVESQLTDIFNKAHSITKK